MPTDTQLLDILQKLADALESLKAEVKTLSEKVNGSTPSEPPTPTPTASWVDVFRSTWALPGLSDWPAEWGTFPWNKDGIISVAQPLKLGVESADQTALIIKLAKWGFAPSNPVTPTAWNLTDLQAVWTKLKVLLDMDEEAWQASIYAKYNIEPDAVAFLTCVEHFDPRNPWTNFGTDTNRPDKLSGENLAHILKRDYFRTGQIGGTPSGNN